MIQSPILRCCEKPHFSVTRGSSTKLASSSMAVPSHFDNDEAGCLSDEKLASSTSPAAAEPTKGPCCCTVKVTSLSLHTSAPFRTAKNSGGSLCQRTKTT